MTRNHERNSKAWTWLQRQSIQARLLGLVLIALLPTVAIAVWHLHTQQEQAREDAQQQARLLTDHTVAALRTTLRDAEAVLATLARRPQLRTLDPARCEAALAEVEGLARHFFTSLSLQRTDGSAVCSPASAARAVEDVRAAPWFESGLARAGLGVSDAYLPPGSTRWMVALTYPVRAQGGEVAGLLIGGLDLAALSEQALASAPEDGVVAVTDRRFSVLLRQPDHAKRVGQAIPQRFVDRLRGRSEGQFEETGYDGVVRVYAFQTMPETGWQVAAGLPTRAVFADYRRASSQTIATMVLAAVGLVAAALLIGGSIVGPVRRLSASVQRVAGGESSHRAAQAGPGEIAAVARQFNRLLDLQAEAEQRLAASEARFRALTELSSDWYWEQDREFRFVSLAPRVGEIVDISAEQHLGKRRWELGPTGLTDEELARHRAQLERHEPFRDLVLQRSGPDGKPRYVAISGEPVFDADGSFTGYRGIGRDITTQRLAERALRASELQYRELIDHLSAGVVVHAPDTAIVLANRAASRILGLSVEQMRGKVAVDPHWRFLRADGTTMPVDEYPVMRVKASGQPVVDLVGAIEPHAGADRVWVIAQAYPEHDAHGELIRIVVIFVDITALRNAEALRTEKEAAERASRSKSEFLSRVSHELRTPLNAILGFGQLLQVDATINAAPATRERVDHVVAAGRHLLAMVNDILDLTRAETGALALSAEVVDAGSVVHECVSLVLPQAASRAIEVAARADADCLVRGDPYRLRQVLMNLLSNAIKYNRQAGRVSADVTGDDAEVRIAIEDTGAGLTPAQVESLFQPFNRLGAERSGVEGTGLGLVIVRLIVQQMGGRIDVASTPGVGSRFTVTLPRCAPEPRSAAGDADPAPFRVLCVDRDALSLQLIENVFAMVPQVTLVTAQDGSEALAIAQRERPDLVLLDLDLPPLDGVAVLQRLRAEPALASVPCIALTAQAMPDGGARVRAAGFSDAIAKPFDVEALLARILRWAADARRG